MRKLWFPVPLFLLLYVSFTVQLAADVTGKIRGRVTDAQDNEPLPGVNIYISHIWEGESERPYQSQMGAATDLKGEYLILKVPPGTYSLTASMMGYQKSIRQKVRVSIDRTTAVDFQLNEAVLDLGAAVVVEAQRDLIQLDVANTENYITQKDYEATPFANRVEDILGMQSGVTGNILESGMMIREGDTREIALTLDGMLMVDKKFNRPVMTINSEMIQEIKVMRNGYSAEYGQSRSGMINIVTRNPEAKFHFALDYQFDPAHRRHYGRNVYDPAYRWDWRLIAGPRAFEGDSLLLNEGKLGEWHYWRGWNQVAAELAQDENPDNDLTAAEALELWKWTHRPIPYGTRTGHNLDFTFSGPLPGMPVTTNFLFGLKYEYHPFTFPQSRTHYDEKVSSLKIISQINPNIKLNFNGLYSVVNSVTQSFSNSEWSFEDRISYDGGDTEIYYPYRKPVIDRFTSLGGVKWSHTLSPTSFYEVNLSYWDVSCEIGHGDSARAEDGRYFHGRLYYDPHSGWIPNEQGDEDLATDYPQFGGAYIWEDSYNRRLVLNAMFTSQFHPAHEFKTGLEWTYDILHQNRIFWVNGNPNQEFRWRTHATPFEVSAFVQDKIEFKGMIANVGLRFDLFDPNTALLAVKRSIEYNNTSIYEAVKNGTYPTYRESPKYYFSPRLGISHPLTEKSKIYFNYGHFVQTPPTHAMYPSALDGRTPRVQWMGNGALTFEKNIAYELGYDQNIGDLFQLHLGAFYKDYHDHVSGVVYAHSDKSLILESTLQRENREIRGLEIEIRKAYGRWCTGWINYNVSKKSVSDLRIPGLSQIPIITDDPNTGVNGELRGIPRQNVQDIVPYGRGVITLTTPDESGPRWKGWSVLSKTSLSFQFFYQGGKLLDHPSLQFRITHPDVKFRELDYYWANIRLVRRFHYHVLDLQFYLDISNVLHSKFREIPYGRSREDYFLDLYNSGRLDQFGTDELSEPGILNTESDNIYRGKLKEYVLGLRFNF